jgi:plasmid maintenance system antidote protein VapI
MAELRIKEILKERNMTSKSLAESMRKAPQYISNIINGGKGVSINSVANCKFSKIFVHIQNF